MNAEAFDFDNPSAGLMPGTSLYTREAWGAVLSEAVPLTGGIPRRTSCLLGMTEKINKRCHSEGKARRIPRVKGRVIETRSLLGSLWEGAVERSETEGEKLKNFSLYYLSLRHLLRKCHLPRLMEARSCF